MFRLRRAPSLLLLLVPLVLGPLVPTARADEETLRTFDVCWKRVKSSFYDEEHHGVDWEAVRREYRPRADAAAPGAELHAVLREMLAELKASHVSLMSAEVHRSMMAELQNRRGPTFGVLLEELRPGELFVRMQYEGGPAEAAGLRVGDRVLRVDGRPPLDSPRVVSAGFDPGLPGTDMYFLAAESEEAVQLSVQSDAEGATRRELRLRPVRMNAVDACRNSIECFEVDGHRIGALHVWYCARGIRELLHEALRGPLADCDALVVDLRGRGGFADVADSLLRVFTPEEGRGRSRGQTTPRWTRPVVFLIDGRTRSAKEILAQRIRRRELGTLVGERTEGAVLAAGFFPLPDGMVLELAIMDVPVDGVRLEGVGVAPHVEVEFDYAYGGGRDPILETGLAAAWALLEQRPAPRP